MQTLLTGFGPFGRVVSNPTQRIVEHLRGESFEGQEVSSYVFPVSYGRVPERLRAMLEIGGSDGRPFNNILLLGVAVGSRFWRVERFGRNAIGPQRDADNVTPKQSTIFEGEAERFPATLSTERLQTAISDVGLPVQASESAGEFLCNFAFYTTLRLFAEREQAPQVGFLHVPADEFTFRNDTTSAPKFSFELHLEAVRAALNALTLPNNEV